MTRMVAEPAVTGREHWTTKGPVRLFLWERRRGRPDAARHHPLRARLVDGLAADVRSEGARARVVGHGPVRAPRLRHVVRRHGGLRPLRQDARHQFRSSDTAPTTSRRLRLHPRDARRGPFSSTASPPARCGRRSSRSATPSASRASPSTPSCGRARAARPSPSARKRLPEFPASEPAADRPRFRAFDLQPRPSGLCRREGDRSLRRRDPRARRLGADRHLRRHVLEAAHRRPAKITSPTIVMRGEYDGIAGFDDLVEFFKRLPNPDKQFAVMPGISHASFQRKNYRTVYHILRRFPPARSGVSRVRVERDMRMIGATVRVAAIVSSCSVAGRRPSAARAGGALWQAPDAVDLAAKKAKATSPGTRRPRSRPRRRSPRTFFQTQTGIKVELFRSGGSRSCGASCRRWTRGAWWPT